MEGADGRVARVRFAIASSSWSDAHEESIDDDSNSTEDSEMVPGREIVGSKDRVQVLLPSGCDRRSSGCEHNSDEQFRLGVESLGICSGNFVLWGLSRRVSGSPNRVLLSELGRVISIGFLKELQECIVS